MIDSTVKVVNEAKLQKAEKDLLALEERIQNKDPELTEEIIKIQRTSIDQMKEDH